LFITHLTVYVAGILMSVSTACDESSPSRLISAGQFAGGHWSHGAADADTAQWSFTHNARNIRPQSTPRSVYSYAVSTVGL